MGYVDKDKVLSSISSRTKFVKGKEYTVYEAYLGTDPITKKPIRVSCSGKEKLENQILCFYKRMKKGGETAVIISAVQTLDAKSAYEILEDAGVKMSLAECAKIAVESVRMKCGISIGEAFEKYIISVKSKSESHQSNVKSRVGRFVESVGRKTPLCSVTAKIVKEYLAEKFYDESDSRTWKTYNNNLGEIKTFIGWCCSIEQDYLKSDPLRGMKNISIPWKKPEYMSPDDVCALFDKLQELANESPEDLAYSVLSFFCGMRVSEIERVAEGEDAVKISLQDRFISVFKCKGATKGVRPRTFKIPEQALSWMMSFDFMSAIMTKNTKYRKHLKEVANMIGLDLPKNVGRHTFCTMFEAVHHDQNALGAIVGNTEDVRANCYNGIATEQEGLDFFAILPRRVVS